jgi:hypothetical protein
MAKITAPQARTILGDLGINPEWEFHVLNSRQVSDLVAQADFFKYRKPKDANGSRARYFHAYLVRMATKIPLLTTHSP